MKKHLLATLTVLLCASTPCWATTIGVNYSATLDLSAYGASSTSTVQGSFSWDPTTAPFATNSNTGYYAFQSASLFINSVDYTAQIVGPNSSHITVYDNAGGDVVSLVLFFSPVLNVGPLAPDIYIMNLDLADTSSTLFSGFALPTSTAFLSSVDATFLAFRSPGFGNETFTQSVSASAAAPVPEPMSMVLVGSGLAALALRRRRHVR
jgi:hypothetical protein